MKVLIACEYSGRVREAFRALGHDAISCDLLPTEQAGPHHLGDVRDLLHDGFDLMIGHPPCTYLSASGLHWNGRTPGRAEKTAQALEFVRLLMAAPIPKKAIENPVGRINTAIAKPTQTINPWQFGDDASKATCLWLEGLPPLRPTKFIEPRMVCCGNEVADKYGCPNCNGDNKPRPRWANQTNSGQNKIAPRPDRWKVRSTTYQGIADAMAAQWGQA
jgi:hypothetical protein